MITGRAPLRAVPTTTPNVSGPVMRRPRPWLLSEVNVAARAILAMEREAAKVRQWAGTSGQSDLRSRATDATARRWGKQRIWLESLLAASEAAAAQPDRLGGIVAWMDRTGSPLVAVAWVRTHADPAAGEAPDLPPEGRRAHVVADVRTWTLSHVGVAAKAILDSALACGPEGSGVAHLDPEKRRRNALLTTARLWGKGADWLQEILDVGEAAEADPKRFGFLVGVMDRGKGGSPARAWGRMDKIFDVERVRSVRPAGGTYRTLVMDVPWREDNISEGSDHNYAQMSLEEILALKDQVLAWAADDFCHLWFWVKNNTVGLGYDIVRHYGFVPKTFHTWNKPTWGQGRYSRNKTEHVIFAIRGDKGCKPAYMSTSTDHDWPYPEGPESSKPDGFYQMVRDLSHEPYGEAFQRTVRPDFANLYVPDEAPVAAAAE